MSAVRKRVLFVLTSASKDLKGGDTGWYLPEAAHPYYILAPHHQITFAAPLGPNPPVAPSSVVNFKDDDSVRFLKDDVVKDKLANALRVKDVNSNDYDAIFYVGGHGPAIDLASDQDNAKLASEIFRAGKPTAAVCHGPAALVDATDANGVSIFKDREFTGLSNIEEGPKADTVPFLLEDRLQEKGGKYLKADQPWEASRAKVVVDGNLITGQNPASAKGVGEALLQALA